MKLATRSSLLAAIAVATAGSSTLLGAGAAFAASPGSTPEACGPDGALVGPGVCEQTFTENTFADDEAVPAVFHRTATMTHLEALLVGAGGEAVGAGPDSDGYASGGGGGEVRVVDLSDWTGDVDVLVGISHDENDPDTETGVTGTAATQPTLESAQTGGDGDYRGGGTSGSGKAGTQPADDATGVRFLGGGGSAGAADGRDGGAGSVVRDLAPAGSLFTGDTDCFGGGGAAGTGTPGCPGTNGSIPANSGQGATSAANDYNFVAGAAGRVVLRWTAIPAVLTLTQPDGTTTTQNVPAGGTPTRPADPSKPGFVFAGWYVDQQLTTLASFDAPLTASTTFYAKFTPAPAAAPAAPAAAAKPALASTGADAAQTAVGAGLGGGALLLGVALALVSRRRRVNR